MNNVKKALSIVLAVCMVLCMMPMSVFADGDVAKIDNIGYATLADAIANVGDDDTITILSNTESEGITVPGGKNFTLDLNEKTVSFKAAGAGSPGTKTAGLQLLKGSNITIKNGNIDIVASNKNLTWTSDSASKGIALLIQNYCNLTIDGVNIDAENIAHNGGTVARYAVSNNNGTTTIKDSTITMAGNDFAFDCYYDNNTTYSAPTVNVEGSTINGRVEAMGNGSTLNLKSGTVVNGQVRVGANQNTTSGDQYKGATVSIANGATVKGVVAVFGGSTLNVNGTVQDGYIASNGLAVNADSVINIGEGANVTAGNGADVAVYVPNGALNVTGGTITGETAVYFKSTAINISGGKLVATGEKKAYDYSGNGANATGDALVIDSCNYPNGIESVSVSGGEFESTNGAAVASFTKAGSESVTGFITGGTFNGAVAMDETLLDENCEINENGEVVPKDVCEINGVGYSSLAEAIAAVPTNGTETTITMLADTTIAFDTATYATVEKGMNIVLDLNGKKITSGTTFGSTSQFICNKGTLTIVDSGENGTIEHGANPTWIADGTGNYNGSYASNLIRNEGIFNLISGTLNNISDGSAAYVIDTYNNGVTNISGGTCIAAKTAIRLFYSNTVLNMTDGEVKAGRFGIISYSNSSSNNVVSISGGSVDTTDTTDELGLYVWGETADSQTTVTISGDADIHQTVLIGSTMKTEDIAITGGTIGKLEAPADAKIVSGGKFKSEVPAGCLAEGYSLVANGDGTYSPYITEYVYTLIEAPNIDGDDATIENGKYNVTKNIYDSNYELVESDIAVDENVPVSFKDWYLRTMVQYKIGTEKKDLRFVSMLGNGNDLDDYQAAGFEIAVDGVACDSLTTTEAYTSFRATPAMSEEEITINIEDYSSENDYFFLCNTTFGTINNDAVITVTPFVTLKTGTTVKGDSVSFTLGDLH